MKLNEWLVRKWTTVNFEQYYGIILIGSLNRPSTLETNSVLVEKRQCHCLNFQVNIAVLRSELPENPDISNTDYWG